MTPVAIMHDNYYIKSVLKDQKVLLMHGCVFPTEHILNMGNLMEIRMNM